jgi:hypothetical protein
MKTATIPLAHLPNTLMNQLLPVKDAKKDVTPAHQTQIVVHAKQALNYTIIPASILPAQLVHILMSLLSLVKDVRKGVLLVLHPKIVAHANLVLSFTMIAATI